MKTSLWAAFSTLSLSMATSGAAFAESLSVCERTPAVKVFIEQALTKTCDQVTDTDLATLTRIAVPSRAVHEFKVGDFSGLPNLEILNIKGNPITQLPNGIFADLPKLKTLVIFRTQLASLPNDFLYGLDQLENLHIFANPFTTIPASVLETLGELAHLQVLDFNKALATEQQAELRQLFPEGGVVELNFY